MKFTQSPGPIALVFIVTCALTGANAATTPDAEGTFARHMARMLTGPGYWSAPNPAYENDKTQPHHYGLRFELADDGQHATGALFGLYDNDKQIVYWSMLSFYNPVTDKVIAMQIGWDGALLRGEVPPQFGRQQTLDMIEHAANGAMKMSRHVLRFDDADTHHSDALERAADGQWEMTNTWKWQRQAAESAPAAPGQVAGDSQAGQIEKYAGHLVAGSGKWRAPNPDYTAGSELPRQFGMNYKWGPHRQHVVGEIVSIYDDGRIEKDWSQYISYNPVTQSAHMEQTGASGIYFRGDLTIDNDGRHIHSGLIYFPDGKVKSVRDEVLVRDATHYVSHVFERDERGAWKKAREWTWTRLP